MINIEITGGDNDARILRSHKLTLKVLCAVYVCRKYLYQIVITMFFLTYTSIYKDSHEKHRE